MITIANLEEIRSMESIIAVAKPEVYYALADSKT